MKQVGLTTQLILHSQTPSK